VQKIVNDRFKAEARILHKLSEHDQIPELYDSFEHAGKFYLVQELIEGTNLEQKVKEGGRFSEGKVKSIIISLLEVLIHIHSAGAVHGDIRPDNIILRDQDQKATLIDFALIKQAVNACNMDTQGYTAPEQTQGATTYDCDLYSLGYTSIYLLTGKSPQELKKSSKDKVSWVNHAPGTSPELAGILDKAVSDEQRKRFKSARQMLLAIRNPTQFNKHSIADVYRNFTAKLSYVFSHFIPKIRKVLPRAALTIVVLAITILAVKTLPLLWFWGVNKSEQVVRWVQSSPSPNAIVGLTTPSPSRSSKTTATVVGAISPSVKPSPTVVISVSPTLRPVPSTPTPTLMPRPTSTKTVEPSPTIAVKPKTTATPIVMPVTVTVQARFVYKLNGGVERPFPKSTNIQLRTFHIDLKRNKEIVDYKVVSEIYEDGYVKFESVPCKKPFKITIVHIDIPEGAAKFLGFDRPAEYPRDTDLLRCESFARVGKYVIHLRTAQSLPAPTPIPAPSESPRTPRPRPDATPVPLEAEQTPRQPVNVSGGVLQGKALKKVQPLYPPIAKTARAQGVVQVHVLISEQGNVIEASIISGHPLLQQAALQAARQWIFQPTLLSGVPIKVEGILTFNFTL